MKRLRCTFTSLMVNQRNAISRQCVEAFSNGSSSCLKGKVDPTLIEDIPETHIEVWNGQWPRNTPYIYISLGSRNNK